MALHRLRGEHRGGDVARAVVDHEGDVGRRRLGFSPAATPAARNPCGCGDALMARLRSTGRPGGLGETEGEVHALHGCAGGALGEVVDRADGDQPAGALVERRPGGARRWSRGSACVLRPLPVGQQVHERLVARRPSRRPPGRRRRSTPVDERRACTVARMPRDIGASTGVNDTRAPAAPASGARFCSISGVCRCTPPTPYADGGAHHLGAEQVRPSAPCPRRRCRRRRRRRRRPVDEALR